MSKGRLERPRLDKAVDRGQNSNFIPNTADIDETQPNRFATPLSKRQQAILILQQTRGNAAVLRMLANRVPNGRIQRRPSYLVDFTFLGWPCSDGVNTVMKARLQAVQADLQATFDALPPDPKTNP